MVRWYLVTPEQYDRAPIGTEVWDDGGCPCGCYWVKTERRGWLNSESPGRVWWDPAFRREIKKWGTLSELAVA